MTDDQKTHKNPGLRKTGPVPSKPGQEAAPAAAKPVAAKKKNPVFECQGGRKWIVVRTIELVFSFGIEFLIKYATTGVVINSICTL